MSQKKFTPVRLSHLLRHCSVGAVIRTPDYLMTVKDTSHWKDGQNNYTGQIIPYVEQVKASLGITDDLRYPPVGNLDKDGELEQGGYYIPAKIFPTWFVCSKCHSLHQNPQKHLSDFNHKNTKKTYEKQHLPCTKCSGSLEQVNLVQIDIQGHMSDVPWYRIVHGKPNHACTKLGYWDEIYLKYRPKDKRIFCERCGQSATINFGEPRFYQGYRQPWLSEKVEIFEDTPEHENKRKARPTAYIMEVSDTRVHIPNNKVALVIPPESRVPRGSLVDRLYRHTKKNQLLNPSQNALQLRALKQSLYHELSCNEDALNDAISTLKSGYPLNDYGLQSRPLAELEYDALITPLDFDKDEDFITHHMTDDFHELINTLDDPILHKWGKLIDKVVGVDKLKEIMVFTGFTRGGEIDLSDDEIDRLVRPDLGKDVGWLPALELYGEGVFIHLSPAYLDAWESQIGVKQRTSILQARYANSSIHSHHDFVLSARFLLLHALSHLLIKEFESVAGYPAASLKEKIYSSADPQNPMSGILIYTAKADIEGTLGGLVELCQPKRLLKILTRVYEHMQWCSLDPVCRTHEGQGPSLLNLAACHGCLLLPETSCMCGNILLDRVILDGNPDMPSIFDLIT